MSERIFFELPHHGLPENQTELAELADLILGAGGRRFIIDNKTVAKVLGDNWFYDGWYGGQTDEDVARKVVDAVLELHDDPD